MAKSIDLAAESQSATCSQRRLPHATALALAVLAALFAMVVWFMASFVAMGVDQARYEEATNEAVRSGALVATYRLPFAPTKVIYPHGGNDCMILAMLITPRDTRLKAAVSPKVPVAPASVIGGSSEGFPPDASCHALANLLFDLNAPGHRDKPLGEIAYYHRYIHGNITTSALLLSILSFRSATILLLGTCYTLLAWLIIATAFRLRSKLSSDRRRGAAFLSVGLSLALFYAMPLFDRTLCFAPIDVAIIAFILFGFYQPLAQISETRLVLSAALFGSVMAIFDSLLGGIPMALAVLIVLVALGGAPNRTVLIRRLTLALGAFLTAIVVCLVCKQLLVLAIWGPDTAIDFASRLGKRIGGGVTEELPASVKHRLDELGLSLSWFDSNLATRGVFAGIMVIYSAFVLAWGSHVVGAAIVLLPLPLLLLLTYFTVRRGPLRGWPVENLTIVGAAIVPFAWYLVFLNHTILHSFIMVRPLALSAGLVSVAWIHASTRANTAFSHP